MVNPRLSKLSMPSWAVFAQSGPNGLVTLADSRENGCGPQEGMGWKQGIKQMGCINGFWIYYKDLGFKSNDSNIFNQNLKWGQTKINLNKPFIDFSNLELYKISLNIQIQTKALNGGFLEGFRKRFQNEI
jgi:hypothetical protein